MSLGVKVLKMNGERQRSEVKNLVAEFSMNPPSLLGEGAKRDGRDHRFSKIMDK